MSSISFRYDQRVIGILDYWKIIGRREGDRKVKQAQVLSFVEDGLKQDSRKDKRKRREGVTLSDTSFAVKCLSSNSIEKHLRGARR